ncbi:hypothetical protein P4O66_018175 [Electrophorus voltai]|uniref:Uncharacterized protein n=1 Tax=Electrophorus voltai TaxID=2609070 RepID=A0AAD8YQG8_9TELE|nr:hypothetical protein P4O66_018175 [Electrophorus voltai]
MFQMGNHKVEEELSKETLGECRRKTWEDNRRKAARVGRCLGGLDLELAVRELQRENVEIKAELRRLRAQLEKLESTRPSFPLESPKPRDNRFPSLSLRQPNRFAPGEPHWLQEAPSSRPYRPCRPLLPPLSFHSDVRATPNAQEKLFKETHEKTHEKKKLKRQQKDIEQTTKEANGASEARKCEKKRFRIRIMMNLPNNIPSDVDCYLFPPTSTCSLVHNLTGFVMDQ